MSKHAELLARYLVAVDKFEALGPYEANEVDDEHLQEIDWLLERLGTAAWARLRDRTIPGYAEECKATDPDDEIVTQEALFHVSRQGVSGTIFEGVAFMALREYMMARGRFGFDDPKGVVGMDFTTKSGVRVQVHYIEPPRFESPFPEYNEEDLKIAEAELLECAVGTPNPRKTA